MHCNVLDCLRDSKEGAIIDLRVVPGSKKTGISYVPWEGRLKVKVSSQARGGKANEEVISLFSGFFGGCVLVSGVGSRKKSVLITGVALDVLSRKMLSLVG